MVPQPPTRQRHAPSEGALRLFFRAVPLVPVVAALLLAFAAPAAAGTDGDIYEQYLDDDSQTHNRLYFEEFPEFHTLHESADVDFMRLVTNATSSGTLRSNPFFNVEVDLNTFSPNHAVQIMIFGSCRANGECESHCLESDCESCPATTLPVLGCMVVQGTPTPTFRDARGGATLPRTLTFDSTGYDEVLLRVTNIGAELAGPLHYSITYQWTGGLPYRLLPDPYEGFPTVDSASTSTANLLPENGPRQFHSLHTPQDRDWGILELFEGVPARGEAINFRLEVNDVELPLGSVIRVQLFRDCSKEDPCDDQCLHGTSCFDCVEFEPNVMFECLEISNNVLVDERTFQSGQSHVLEFDGNDETRVYYRVDIVGAEDDDVYHGASYTIAFRAARANNGVIGELNSYSPASATVTLNWDSGPGTAGRTAGAQNIIGYRISRRQNVDDGVFVPAEYEVIANFAPREACINCERVPLGPPQFCEFFRDTFVPPAPDALPIFQYRIERVLADSSVEPYLESFITPPIRPILRSCAAGDPMPVITLEPTQVFFDDTAKGETATATFTIQNTGAGTLNFALAEDDPWLTLSAQSGTVTGSEVITITATADTSALAEETEYIADVRVTDTGNVGVVPRSVVLRIFVTPQGPVFHGQMYR